MPSAIAPEHVHADQRKRLQVPATTRKLGARNSGPATRDYFGGCFFLPNSPITLLIGFCCCCWLAP